MSVDTDESRLDTENLLVLSKAGIWAVGLIGLGAAAASLISTLSGSSDSIELLFFTVTCSLPILCFGLFHKIVQVLRRLEEETEKYRAEQKET